MNSVQIESTMQTLTSAPFYAGNFVEASSTGSVQAYATTTQQILSTDFHIPRRTAIPIAIVLGLVLVGISWTICRLVKARKRPAWRKRMEDEEKRGARITTSEREMVDRQDPQWQHRGLESARIESAGPSQGGVSLPSSQGVIQRPPSAHLPPQIIVDRPPVGTLRPEFTALHLRLAQPHHPGYDPQPHFLPQQGPFLSQPHLGASSGRPFAPPDVAVDVRPTGSGKGRARRLTPYRLDKPLPPLITPDWQTSRQSDVIPQVAGWDRPPGYMPPSPSFVSSVVNPESDGLGRVHRVGSTEGQREWTSPGGLPPWPVLTREAQDARWTMYLD